MGKVRDYIESKGWTVKKEERIRGKVNLVLDCPLCGAQTTRQKKRFYICEESGVFICNDCQERGNLYLLKKALGDLMPLSPMGKSDALDSSLVKQITMPQQPASLAGFSKRFGEKWARALLEDEFAVKWVTEGRSIPLEDVKRFRLGMVFKQGRRFLAIPFIADDKTVLIKYRSMEGEKSFERMPGCPSPLYNMDSLAGEWKRVYITEGELDAISLESMGLKPAVSLPSGAQFIPDEIKAVLEKVDDIYICTDMDKAGHSAARKIADALGPYRCFRVNLPQKDANDCLRAGLAEDVKRAVDNAHAMGLGQVISLVDALDAAVSEGQALDRGWSTGLYDLDLILGGLRRGEWTVISGDTGAGKTVTQMGLGTSLIKSGVGVMLACLELHPHEVAIRWASQLLGESIHRMSPDDKKDAPGRIRSLGASGFIVPTKGYVSISDLGGMLEFCVRRHGVGVFSVDHLDYIVTDVDDMRALNQAVMGFDALVSKFHVHGVLGAHPNKTESVDKKGSPRRIRMGDIRGSSKIKQLAYNIIIADPEDPKTGKKVLRVEKRRWTGNTVAIPARMTCRFDKKSLNLVNDTQDEGYGIDYKMFAAGDN